MRTQDGNGVPLRRESEGVIFGKKRFRAPGRRLSLMHTSTLSLSLSHTIPVITSPPVDTPTLLHLSAGAILPRAKPKYQILVRTTFPALKIVSAGPLFSEGDVTIRPDKRGSSRMGAKPFCRHHPTIISKRAEIVTTLKVRVQ